MFPEGIETTANSLQVHLSGASQDNGLSEQPDSFVLTTCLSWRSGGSLDFGKSLIMPEDGSSGVIALSFVKPFALAA
jgi:hypothetical protein